MGKIPFLLLAILSFAMLALSGCIGGSIPSACASASPERMANCIYNVAVLEQNPNYCYSISDMDQRKICMRDAADPGVKKALQRSTPSESQAVFTEPSQ